MNAYFLVEGRRTEVKLYPAWLSVLCPNLTRVTNADAVSEDNYYIFNGGGYPSILNHIHNAIEDINNIGKYDYLIICVDADEATPEQRFKEIKDYLAQNHIVLHRAQLFIIIQNRTIETWLLGNRRIVCRTPNNRNLIKYLRFYDVINNDPEKCPKHRDFSNHAHFHEAYLKEIFRERGLSYSKINPGEAQKPAYLNELINRIQKTNDLKSFSLFYQFVQEHLKN